MLRIFRSTLAVMVASFMFTGLAHAGSRFDAYFGMGTAQDGAAKQPVDFLGMGSVPGPHMGGAFGTFGGGLMLTPSLGFGAEMSLRFSQGDYAGLGYRPIFYDFNGIWTPSLGLGKRIMPEFQAGFGGLNLRFYNPGTAYYDYYTGNMSDYFGSSNHLQLHAGFGLRFYVKPHLFVRPQIDYHWVRNLTNEFGSNSVPEFSVAIGYSSGE